MWASGGPDEVHHVVVLQNRTKLPVAMRNTQDIASLHTNAGDCNSGCVQKVALLLYKRHFLI